MSKQLIRLIVLSSLLACAFAPVSAQVATGTISGTVTDETGAVIPSATLVITNRATSASRTVTANAEGFYDAPALLAGDYDVRATVQGFRTVVRQAQVLAGTTTTVDLAMSLGTTQEVVNVEAAVAQINYDSHTVQGSIERQSVQELPLNGRNFMQLASIQPGVTVAPQVMASKNAPIQISILGAPSQYTELTVDGMTIRDELDSAAGTSMNFSQEIVQEFQVSSVNFDLSTGITASGAINIVTRSGGNDFHGSAYLFYRDHNLAAYPALKRNSFNPNPFFARKDGGFWLGGPIIKDKLFYFFNYEYMTQVQAISVQPDLASVAPSAGTFGSPYTTKSLSGRFDYRFSTNTSLFLRYTHDGNDTYAPVSGTPFPSQWSDNSNWSDQSVIAVTSILKPNVVNDARFMYKYWHEDAILPTRSECPGACFGYSLPFLTMIGSSNFSGGSTNNNPQHFNRRDYEIQDTVSWQKGSHQIKFGGDLDIFLNNWLYGTCEVGCLQVVSVETTRSILGNSLSTYVPNLPGTVTTNADLLSLPVEFPASGAFQTGTEYQPGPYHQIDKMRNFRPRGFVEDAWKLRPNLTVRYGLGYAFESALFNSDIPEPKILAPILNNNLSATPPNYLNFTPSVGFAWSPGKSGKTVVRGGAGLYWDTVPQYYRTSNGTQIEPVGDGRAKLPASLFTNIFPGIVQQTPQGLVPLPVGALLPTATFTNLTLSQAIQIYNQQIPAINLLLNPANPQTSGPVTTSVLDLVKSGNQLFPNKYPNDRSYQTSLGVQRDVGHGLVITADWARRQAENVLLGGGGTVDLNHFTEYINGVQSPVIPKCTTSQLFVANIECSSGAMQFFVPEGRSVYEAMLLTANKRFSNRYQFLVSYALQNLHTNSAPAPVVNLNNYFQSYGPVLPRHNLNISGLVDFPWGLELSVNSQIISRTPVMPNTTNIDLSGTGQVSSGPLPGLSFNCGGNGCGKDDLTKAVANFNSTYGGKKAPNGTTIPSYILPSHYQFGDPTFAQDFRLTKTFTLKEHYKFAIMAEFFNAFNIANLTGYSFNLDTVKAVQTFAFGQPTQRASQIFLSGGPRAEQFAARFSF
ncbi:MAG TPA: carboxypeptidase regulatory-like domain-containing protein [Bryobacteraceae bacterium]|nr:carboxypeptidase regulatory-like domain-containing protein [Bryobacteraceae bacterium]